MGATHARIPFSGTLLSIKGLGIVSVAGLIGEVGDFSKFSTQSEIMKVAGLDLYEISSGKRKGQRKISKRGRSLLRKILFYAAIQMIPPWYRAAAFLDSIFEKIFIQDAFLTYLSRIYIIIQANLISPVITHYP